VIDTTTGAHIWADRFDGALDDIFELQDMKVPNSPCRPRPSASRAELRRRLALQTVENRVRLSEPVLGVLAINKPAERRA
jgi:hypothetical protein